MSVRIRCVTPHTALCALLDVPAANFASCSVVSEAGAPSNSAADPGSLWGLVVAAAVCCVLVGS